MTEYLNYREIFAKLKSDKYSYISLLPNDIYRLIYELIPEFSAHLIIYKCDGTSDILTFRKSYEYIDNTINKLTYNLQKYYRYKYTQCDRDNLNNFFNETPPDWFPIDFNYIFYDTSINYQVNNINNIITVIPINGCMFNMNPFTMCKFIDDIKINNKKDI